MASESEPAIDRAVEAFEEAIRRGERPRIVDFVAEGDPVEILIELAHVDLEHRLKSGEDATAGAYLAAHPPLAGRRGAAVDLVEAEYRFRSRIDPTFGRGDLKARYPEFADDLDDPEEDRPGDRPPEEIGPGAVIGGRYALVERLGEGGMGEVWKARQVSPVRREVAIKLVKPGMDSRAVLRRFEAERQALARMDHPGIARVFDAGLTAGHRPYFVMELVDGPSLTTYCDGERLGIRARLALFVAICRAVEHAHQKGIVHRDLKPSNILVTTVDGQPAPKVIDFGLARALGGDLAAEAITTGLGTVVGTLEYMAPEQATPGTTDIDTRADIYALGIILYELLTGLRPFDAARLRRAAFDEMIRVIREEEPSKPSARLSTAEASPSIAADRRIDPARLAKMLRGELDWVVMKCLEKGRDRRYDSASGLARDLERFLGDEPVEARPPAAGYRLRKFLRRNRRGAIASAVVGAAVVVGAAAAAWGLVVAARAETRAAIEAATADRIADYLARTFESADPVGLDAIGFRGPGDRSDDRTARRLLDRGAEIIDESLGDRPLVRARLLDAIGGSYRNLGEWDAARDRLDQAHATRRALLGDAHEETVASLQALAHLARDSGDYDDADRLYRLVIARREALFSPDHLLVAESKAYLAWMTFFRPLSDDGPQFDAARLAEAERLLLDVLRVRQAKLPADHRDIGATLAALASVKLSQPDQTMAALGYAGRAGEIFRRSDGDTFFAGLMVELVLADGHRKAGRYDRAEAAYLKVLTLFRRHLGERHPLVLIQLANLAGLYRQAGRLDDAERVVAEVLAIVRPMPSFRNRSAVVDLLIQYADEVRRRRSPAEAARLYREAKGYALERPRDNAKNLKALESRIVDAPDDRAVRDGRR